LAWGGKDESEKDTKPGLKGQMPCAGMRYCWSSSCDTFLRNLTKSDNVQRIKSEKSAKSSTERSSWDLPSREQFADDVKYKLMELSGPQT
jgi:hypothetical protein